MLSAPVALFPDGAVIQCRHGDVPGGGGCVGERSGRNFEYREARKWIRGNSPHTAEFVPPHPSRVLPAMDDLVAFMRRDDILALTQAAIAHAQFETIHPFADGNGRSGRAIVSALLRAKGITRNVTVPVSAGLLTDTGAYFDALGEYREGFRSRSPSPLWLRSISCPYESEM